LFYILAALTALFVGYLAFSPNARLARELKAFLRRLVLRPKVRLYLDLDPIAPPVSLRAIQKLVGDWTSSTYVAAGGLGACAHIGDEVLELREILQKIKDSGELNPEDQYELSLELADLEILIIDIAYAHKVDLTDATLLKHYINTLRKWGPPDERGVQHHIEPEVEGTIARSVEEERRLLKNLSFLGREKLAAIIAKPDPTIAAALNEVLNEDEPLTGMPGGDFKP
jgi:hypothetical protein